MVMTRLHLVVIFKERLGHDGHVVDDNEGGDLDEAALGVDHHRLKDWLLSWKRGSHLTTSPFLQNDDFDFQPRNITMLDKKIHPPPLCPTPGESCRWLEGPRSAQGRCLLEGGVDLWQGRKKKTC